MRVQARQGCDEFCSCGSHRSNRFSMAKHCPGGATVGQGLPAAATARLCCSPSLRHEPASAHRPCIMPSSFFYRSNYTAASPHWAPSWSRRRWPCTCCRPSGTAPLRGISSARLTSSSTPGVTGRWLSPQPLTSWACLVESCGPANFQAASACADVLAHTSCSPTLAPLLQVHRRGARPADLCSSPGSSHGGGAPQRRHGSGARLPAWRAGQASGTAGAKRRRRQRGAP